MINQPVAGSVKPQVQSSGKQEMVLLARAVSGGTVLGEQVLDQVALADLVLEAIEESQRQRGVVAQTSWWDAAAAAELIIDHVVQLASE